MLRRALRQFGQVGWIQPTVLFLLIAHLGRFYSDAPTALAICFDHNHLGVSISAAHDHHEHGAAAAADHYRSENSGYQIEHCRDVYQGLNLAPALSMAPPTDAIALVPDERIRAIVYVDSLRPTEPSQSIFHPPQLLS